MFMEVHWNLSSSLFKINVFNIFYLEMDFLEIISRQLGVGSEQP